jgi:DDE_Tnp_1-associated/Transposase DDE domain
LEAAPAGSLLACLRRVPDPRGAQGRRHSSAAMLATIVCAVLCGARGFDAIAQWIHCQRAELWYLLGYFRRPPTSGAYRYLLTKLSPDVLEQALREWIAPLVEDRLDQGASAVAMDGKTLCGTLGEHGRSLQLLSLFDQKTGCVLSQLEVPQDTNEAKAALSILRTVVLTGRVITADAIFCQSEICREIVAAGGDYLIVVKDNQQELKDTIAGDFLPGFSPRDAA